jgi:hypothetical protein
LGDLTEHIYGFIDSVLELKVERQLELMLWKQVKGQSISKLLMSQQMNEANVGILKLLVKNLFETLACVIMRRGC